MKPLPNQELKPPYVNTLFISTITYNLQDLINCRVLESSMGESTQP